MAKLPPEVRRALRETRDLSTEGLLPEAACLDRMDVEEVLALIHREDRRAFEAVERALPRIAKAVERYAATLRRGGRVFYVGAGTSGRLGVLDAVELWPTYRLPWDRVQGLVAGGVGALVRAMEGAEDREEDAVRDLRAVGLSAADLVIALAASARTPYCVGALRYAREVGAGRIFIVAVPEEEIPVDRDLAEIWIPLPVGPEVVAGSTRMKAALAQKMVLTMLSTAAMVRLGKVYGNRMVDLVATSGKLKARALRILEALAGLAPEEGWELLEAAGGSLKVALVMATKGCDARTARALLEEADGMLHRIIDKA